MNHRFFMKIIQLGGLFFLLAACEKKIDTEKEISPLAKKGKAIYLSNCIACHNPDPTISGSIGPAIAKSSYELIEARVLHRTYPPGYKPQRDSQTMPDFPQLKADIPSLHAYLNSL